MCSISSRTNSPACVLGARPCRRSRRALSSVLCCGMCISSVLLADQNLPDPHDHRSLAGGGCVLHGLIIEIALAKLDKAALLRSGERRVREEGRARWAPDP